MPSAPNFTTTLDVPVPVPPLTLSFTSFHSIISDPRSVIMHSFFKKSTKAASAPYVLGNGIGFDQSRLGGHPTMNIKPRTLAHHLQPSFPVAIIARALYSSSAIGQRCFPDTYSRDDAVLPVLDFDANEDFIVRGVTRDWLHVQSMKKSTKDGRVPHNFKLFSMLDSRGRIIHPNDWEDAQLRAGLNQVPMMKRMVMPVFEQPGLDLGKLDQQRFVFQGPKPKKKGAKPEHKRTNSDPTYYPPQPPYKKRNSLGRKW